MRVLWGYVLGKIALAMVVVAIVFASIGINSLANDNPCVGEKIACTVVKDVLH